MKGDTKRFVKCFFFLKWSSFVRRVHADYTKKPPGDFLMNVNDVLGDSAYGYDVFQQTKMQNNRHSVWFPAASPAVDYVIFA